MTLYAKLAGLPEPVALPDDRRLVDCLARALNGWRFDLSETAERPAFARIERRRRGFRLTSRWLEEASVAETEVGAVTSLLVDLGYAFAAASPGRLCLHAGAAEFDRRLVVFPSATKAGKSTLIAALAMSGVRIFADDLLPVEGGSARGVALGTCPRLRRPLARGAGPRFAPFVNAHAGPADEDNLFLRLPRELHAPHGETAPLGAFVLLDRRGAGPAEIAAAATGTGLRRLILQSLATPAAADAVFARLRRLVEEVPCFTLRYARPLDAVAVLREQFGDRDRAASASAPGGRGDPRDRPPRSESVRVVPSPAAASPPASSPAGVGTARAPAEEGEGPGADDGGRRSDARAVRLRRSAEAALHEVGGEAFLVHPDRAGIYALDPVALIVWKLFERPRSRADVALVLADLFPHVQEARIQRDVGALVGDLAARGLLAQADAPAKKKGAPKRRPSRRTFVVDQTE